MTWPLRPALGLYLITLRIGMNTELLVTAYHDVPRVNLSCCLAFVPSVALLILTLLTSHSGQLIFASSTATTRVERVGSQDLLRLSRQRSGSLPTSSTAAYAR
jgi:hypothetical protein